MHKTLKPAGPGNFRNELSIEALFMNVKLTVDGKNYSNLQGASSKPVLEHLAELVELHNELSLAEPLASHDLLP